MCCAVQVKEVVGVGRGIGLWGDIVVTLKDGAKLEMRSLPDWQDKKAYLLKRRDEVGVEQMSPAATSQKAKGFS